MSSQDFVLKLRSGAIANVRLDFELDRAGRRWPANEDGPAEGPLYLDSAECLDVDGREPTEDERREAEDLTDWETALYYTRAILDDAAEERVMSLVD